MSEPRSGGEDLLAVARAHRAGGRFEEALEALGALLDRDAAAGEALVEFIGAAVEAGQPALAHERLARYTRAQPFAVNMLHLHLQLSIGMQQWPEAALALEKLIVLEENNALVARLRPRLQQIRRRLRAGDGPARAGRHVQPGGRHAVVAGDPHARHRLLLVTLSSPPSICTFYERALRRAHDVVTVGPMRDRASWEQYAEGLKDHVFYRQGSGDTWVEVCAARTEPCDIVTAPAFIDMAEIAGRLPAGFQPDLFIWVDQDRFTIPINLGALACPTVALFGDTHIDLDWRLRYAPSFDHVFVMFNRQHIARFVEAGCRSVHWCPAAVDPEIHVSSGVTVEHDVAFVGSTHPALHRKRVERLQWLLAQGVHVYIDSRPLEAASRVLASARIVLNDTIADDLNMRVFEALASGALLLTNRLPAESGLGELFVDGEHLVLYDGEEDLLDKIRYFLDGAHAAERLAIAAAGQREVLARHTYDHRVAQIMTTLRGQN